MGSGFLAALAALAQPIAARVLLALGFSVVTVGGVTASFAAVKDALLASIAGAPLGALQLFGLGGGWEALGMVLGAMSWAVAFWGLTKATSLLGTAA